MVNLRWILALVSAGVACSYPDLVAPDAPQTPDGADHPPPIAPSNGVGLDDLSLVDAEIAITGEATFDTDTGQVAGSIVRAPVVGIDAGIAFRVTHDGLGVFTFHRLTVATPGTIRFVGTRAAVFVVETVATIEGTVDGSGGCAMTTTCAGPGGGTGASRDAVATGCGAGSSGIEGASVDDAGGGGAGAGAVGAPGGGGTNPPASVRGAGGGSCLQPTGQPLRGGSGGGAGSSRTEARGGGGGGGFQLTALEQIDVSGTITMAGGGGAGGPGTVGTASPNAGAGGGGGSGGTILIEAPTVLLGATTILAANGGGGGGGGESFTTGLPGARGNASATPALGGIPAAAEGQGGNGGARDAAATSGTQPTSNSNGGGGGGGVGVIFLRADVPTLAGTISPKPTTAAL